MGYLERSLKKAAETLVLKVKRKKQRGSSRTEKKYKTGGSPLHPRAVPQPKESRRTLLGTRGVLCAVETVLFVLKR